MSGIFTAAATPNKPKCARCGRPFAPKKEGDRYGEKCTRILAGQVMLDSNALVSGKVLRKRTFKDKPDPECPVDPDVCPGDCGHSVEDDISLDDIPDIEETVIP